MQETRKRRLAEFVTYAKSLSGDEKGEAQVFLDRLFRGFGRDGYKEAGATLEYRVKNNRQGTSFADLVWKPVVLIEMKKRGEDLADHLTQAFDYWIRLVPNRPRYVVLCNFDEFRIYDFDKDINEPQDTITLDELPERYGPLNFLFVTNERPVFRVDREKVTRDAADLLAQTYNRLAARRDVGPQTAQRFILQMLVSLFSEDIGLLPRHFVTQLLEDCTDPPKAFDLLHGLFSAMNSSGGSIGGRFKDVAYFDGGIFATPAPVELASELPLLKQAAQYNWAHISPDIFGTIFQHSMGAEQRHAYGAHYTSQADIMKIVGPTIGQPWRRAIEEARSPADLHRLRERLQTFTVLDPACGSGNFLYLAYRELKRVEKELIKRLRDLSPKQDRRQREFGFVRSSQFYGIDILPFAVELAKVTMALAHKLAIDELHIQEKALPLDNLDSNIACADALIDENGVRAVWPATDVIIGNPPFLGAKRLKPERGVTYVNAIRSLYPEVPGMADYCVYWFRRAHDHLRPATSDDPVAGRAGLVGTQNIRNNQSRVGGLDYVVRSGVIVEAVENQPWSGEANVHVSIANWVKTAGHSVDESTLLIPAKRRLWSKFDPSLPLFLGAETVARPQVVTRGKRGGHRKDKSYELVPRLVDMINSALSDQVDASTAEVLSCNTMPQRVFQGNTPGHDGFVLTPVTAKRISGSDLASAKVVYPYLIGREMVSGNGRPERFVIDFGHADIVEASAAKAALGWIEVHVLPDIEDRARKEEIKNDGQTVREEQLGRWWLHWRSRADRVAAITRLSGRFIACSRVTKRPVFVFIDSRIRPGDALQTFAFDDDYSFGILQSNAHWQWFIAKCSKLKSDFRYTPESVFDTFPWPQSPSKKQIRAVAAAGRGVRAIRTKALPTIMGGLRALYRTLELPGENPLKDAHSLLDAAVLDAYGFSGRKDLLKQLLDLNIAVAAAIKSGEPVIAPGFPLSYGDPSDLITDDCIKP
jgi:SAM-dependent methyltransferase